MIAHKTTNPLPRKQWDEHAKDRPRMALREQAQPTTTPLFCNILSVTYHSIGPCWNRNLCVDISHL